MKILNATAAQRTFIIEISEHELYLFHAGLLQARVNEACEKDKCRLIELLNDIHPELTALY